MLYDNYQKKIFRIANTLKKLIALIPKIIAVLVAILVLFVAFAVTKGIFIKQVECADSFVYGDTIDCKANALFSAVRYEYAEKGSDNWQSIAPNSPGEYRVRAVSKTVFGGFKYGDEIIFKILPKAADVFVDQSSIVYGETPSVASKELVKGDKIECTNVLYNDIVQKSTQVVPDVEKLKIFDANGNDVTAAYDLSPISTEITILPRALAVLVSDRSREYNGIKFAYDQYEISGGSLKDGDQLRATFDKYLIDVGSIVNQPQLQIVTEQGKDVTHHYEITETVGTLSVEKRPIIIAVQNLSEVYDAQKHSCYDFLVDPSTTIVSGHKINVISGTVAENVGSYENILSFEIVDAQGEVKTDNYSLLIEKGSIDITPRPVTVTTMDESCLYDGKIHSGSKYTVEGLLGDYHFAKVNNAVSMENVGTQDNVIDILIYDIQDPGKSQMENYEISYVYGTFEIEARPITVKAPSVQWIYDGMPHEYITPEIVSELGLVNSQEFIVNGYSTITDVGAIENIYTEYYVLEGKEDRTNNYDITWEYGILEVLPRPIVVSPETVEKYYDDTPLVPNKAGIAGDSPYLLVEGHTIVADVSGSRTEAGESKSLVENVEIFDGSRNVSNNYDISTANGIIRVLKRPISVVVKDARKIYDGTPLTSEEYDLLPMGNLDFALVQGHRLDVVIFGSQTEVGQSPNCVNLAKSKIYNENGLDVTKNYHIEKVDGTLTVVPRKIIIHILDATKVYDGTPLTSNLHEVLATDLLPIALIEGHRMDLHTTGQQTDVGKSINEPDMLLTRIYDTDDRDVTDNYTITYTAGFLIVTPRAIIVDVTNASKVYDGTPLTSDAHEVLRVDPLEFALVEGHAVKLVTLGSQTDVGVSENFADPDATRIFDESGRDVTFNYSISFIEGLLEVTPRPIIVQVSYASKQYDRTPLTSNKFTVQYEAPLEFGLVDGHQAHLVTLGSQTEIGESINAVDTDNFWISDENDRNVTFNYSVSFVDGILKVIPRKLTVIVSDAAKCYDGTPLISHVYEAIGLLEGDRIELVIVGSQTEIGSSANVAAPDATMIYDADGNDVMHHYDITYKDGTLTVVSNAVLLIKTESAQKEYDATPLTNPNYSIEILDGAIAPNHNLSVNVYGSQTVVGMSKNFCEISITDEFGNIVSSNYKCLFELGTLKVTKKVEEPEEPDLPDLPGNPGTNLDTSGQISGGDIVEGEPDGGDVVVLKLRADRTGSIYLRLMSFGSYCGSKWDSASEYGQLLDGKYSYNYLTGVALQNLGTAPTFLEIESFTSDYLLPYYLGVGEGNYMLQASDVKYMSDGAKEYTLSYYVYEGYGVGMAGNLGEYADEEREYRAFVRNQYLALDDVTRAYMLKLIAEQKFDRKDPEIIKKVANYIQNAATYNLKYDRALDAEENIAIAFLETYKEGICQHYATSAVLLYRALGIPARYTIGFVADSVAGEWVEVTPMTAHAWVEVYINGFGWISVEVTGGDSFGNPDIPEEPDIPDNPGNPGTNLDTSGQISGGDIVEGEPDGDVVVLKLRADRTGSIYLRLMSFGSYCGSKWDSASEYGQLLDGKYSYNYLTGVALQNLGTAPTFLEIESFTSDYLLPYYLGVGEGNYMLQASDVKYMSDGAKEYTLSYYVYEGYGVGMAGNLGEYADEEREYRAFVRNQYLALDDVTRAYMLKLIAEQKFDRKDPEIIKKVANYIQNAATYNLKYDRALDAEENIAIAFLETYKEGICQHYATSAVLLYRALGIPARYTIGFVADSVAGEWVEVTPMTAHAWVEVYINGFGWISVEVTGGGFSGGGSGGGSGGNVPEFEETILERIYIAPTYTYKNYDGTLLYAQNKVDVNHVLSDLLKLGYTYEVEVSGKRTKIGRTSSSIEKFVLYDPNGKDVTSEFDIIMESGVVEVFSPDKKILPLYLYELQKYYDGEVLEFDSDCYEVIDPFYDLDLDIQFNISLKSAGSIILADINKNIDKYVSYTIYLNGIDVTHEYAIVFDLFDQNVLDYVPIRVDQRNIELTTASETKIDDGKPLSNPNVMISKGTLVSGDTLTAHANGILTNVGSNKNFLDKRNIQITDENGNDVTKNYKITVIFGVLEILPSDE